MTSPEARLSPQEASAIADLVDTAIKGGEAGLKAARILFDLDATIIVKPVGQTEKGENIGRVIVDKETTP